MYRPVQNSPQTRQPGQQSVKGALFSNKNRDTLTGLLTQDFQSRIGHSLTAKQHDRLERTLDHYVDEVYDKQGEQPLPVLNREILKAVSQDFGMYLQRAETVRNSASTPTQTIMNEAIYQDTGKRFELLQQERNEIKALPPAVPDFRVSLDEEGAPSSVELFERAKKAREAEIARTQTMLVSGGDAADRMDPGIRQRIAADDMFRSGQMNANRSTDIVLMERQNTPRQAPLDMPLVVMPDRRELMRPSNFAMETSGMPRDLGQANSNVTITQPQIASPLKTNLQQDVLIRQDDIVNYKEVENNLFIYSADRDWLNSSVGQNRYVFSIVFDPAINSLKFPPTPAVQERFRNITRVELVKAILPVEALDILITQNPDASGSTNITSYQDNVLSFPYISVNVEELDSNNYGTDNILDRCFAVLQYDANWYSDPNSLVQPQDSRGYTAFIPKFLKCQRVYSPTPLSTLQKMTISLLRPDGTALSLSQDTLDIQNIWAGNNGTFGASSYDGVDGTGNPYYFFIQTNTFFSRYQISVGDRIRVGGYTYDNTTLAANPGLADLAGWVNQTSGLLVAAIGYGNGTAANYTADGPNSVGYANYIIIQARYADPTTGSVALSPFSGITAALAANSGNLLAPRRLINLNRQIQLVFRVITREMDSVAQLRPDNVN